MNTTLFRKIATGLAVSGSLLAWLGERSAAATARAGRIIGNRSIMCPYVYCFLEEKCASSFEPIDLLAHIPTLVRKRGLPRTERVSLSDCLLSTKPKWQCGAPLYPATHPPQDPPCAPTYPSVTPNSSIPAKAPDPRTASRNAVCTRFAGSLARYSAQTDTRCAGYRGRYSSL